MKFLFVFGTRPEAIKLCPLILHLKTRAAVEVCVTGQHKELLHPFLKLFNVTPDYDLDLLKPNQSLSGLTAACIQKLEPVLEKSKPDCVIVQGDTTTSMCAALSAFYQKIPVAHVEAGLRTHDIYSPFPEELNRTAISRIAQFHFVPTKKNKDHLLSEGVDANKIHITGNTVVNALEWVLENHLIPIDQIIPDHQDGQQLILVTGHRRENFGKPFEQICLGIRQIADAFPDTTIIYPVHLNPNVQKPVYKILNNCHNIRLIDPQGYPEFISLMYHADVVLTDSGGVQEEAPTFRVPMVVARDVTERQEVIDQGFGFLVGTDPEVIFNTVKKCLTDPGFYQPKGSNPYGNKNTVKIIADILLN